MADMAQETPEQRLARLLMAQGNGAAPAMPPQALAAALGQPQTQNTFDPQPVDPNTPSGERPLVGGGLQNAIDMLAQSGPAQKAQTYARALMDAARHPGDAYSGREPAYLGLRREDFSDDPNAPQPNARAIASGVTLGDVMSMGSMPAAAAMGAERSALGVGVPPRMQGSGAQITEGGAPRAANRNASVTEMQAAEEAMTAAAEQEGRKTFTPFELQRLREFNDTQYRLRQDKWSRDWNALAPIDPNGKRVLEPFQAENIRMYGDGLPQPQVRLRGPTPANVNSRYDLAQTNQKTDEAMAAIQEALKYAPPQASKTTNPLLDALRGLFGRKSPAE